MKRIILLFMAWSVIAMSPIYSQTAKLDISKLQVVSVSMSSAKIRGKDTIRVIKDPAVKEIDEPTFAKLKNVNFKNGTIEVKVLSRLLKDAPETARGFIGIAFRINESNSKFECIYVRPTNGRVEVQLRRNRATQYFSFPEFKFDRLRKESPREYESYVDIGLFLTVREKKGCWGLPLHFWSVTAHPKTSLCAYNSTGGNTNDN